uniref:Uncharacterized protein n=1 Tax=Oryza brachyantha TaxID=4533 RepID=J3N7Z7_ORYBR
MNNTNYSSSVNNLRPNKSYQNTTKAMTFVAKSNGGARGATPQDYQDYSKHNCKGC